MIAIQPIDFPSNATTGDLFSSRKLFLTGSYDDRLRLFQMPDRGITRPILIGDVRLCGGVWRIKILEQHIKDGYLAMRLGIACMHASAFIIDLKILPGTQIPDPWTCSWTKVAHFTDHQSMCYGLDAQPVRLDFSTGSDIDYPRIIATCSFYDR